MDTFDLRTFSLRNLARCESPRGFNHPIAGWTEAEWFTALAGEVGELGGVIKERLRNRDRVPGKGMGEDEIRAALANEIADVAIYLDLLAQRCGIDLSSAIEAKFARKSAEIGYVDALAAPALAPEAERRKDPRAADLYWADGNEESGSDSLEGALDCYDIGEIQGFSSAFWGPNFFAARVPVLNAEGEDTGDTEIVTAETSEACQRLVDERMSAGVAAKGGAA